MFKPCVLCDDKELCEQLGFCIDVRASSVVILKDIVQCRCPDCVAKADAAEFARLKSAFDATMETLDPTAGPLHPED
jgi:hypothetical protein